MNRLLLYILLVMLPITLNAQDDKAKTWETEREFLKYEKKDGYKGPTDWYGSTPAEMQDESNYNSGGSSSRQGIRYVPQRVRRDRNRRRGYNSGGGSGTLPSDPKVQPPPPVQFDIDPPDMNAPDIDPPSISSSFWKVLLFILIAALVVTILYFIFKNAKPVDRKIIVDVEDDWNPEVITKTELELRLEAAMQREDYRECVRIYFTFILKELIRKSWIVWRKEKTNHHYVMEMAGKPNQLMFMECVRIYDLVWYGEYEIDQEIFEMLRPTLQDYYKSLDPVNE
ncbi:MAG: hypothetical protein HWE22_14915 [Flavobacteriales bacterium]|nr:hypothetical protein [Flavobacteriales bacterium]